jgi:uncharacterized protein YbjT (DUF2867 family)
VRFPKGPVDHRTAVANSRTLFHAARDAGVARIVHVSITHPSAASPYSYFRGKAEVERILGEAGVPYAILRPAILFGGEGVLINNIAWLLRRLPVFAVGGTGAYRIRPVHIDDLARPRVVRVPGALIPAAAQVLGWAPPRNSATAGKQNSRPQQPSHPNRPTRQPLTEVRPSPSLDDVPFRSPHRAH